MTDDETASRRPLGDHVSRAIRRLREEQRLPYTELSERLTSLGRPIPVLGLRRIERGGRRVDVDDLAALAKALGVPPVLLLFPLGREDTVEVLPGRRVDTWRALKWFTAEAPFTGEETRTEALWSLDVDDTDMDGWNRGGLIVELFRQHQARMMEWSTAHDRAIVTRRRAERAETESERAALLEQAGADDRAGRAAELALREVRNQIGRYGVKPPALNPYLAFIDGGLAAGEGREATPGAEE